LPNLSNGHAASIDITAQLGGQGTNPDYLKLSAGNGEIDIVCQQEVETPPGRAGKADLYVFDNSRRINSPELGAGAIQQANVFVPLEGALNGGNRRLFIITSGYLAAAIYCDNVIGKPLYPYNDNRFRKPTVHRLKASLREIPSTGMETIWHDSGEF
jgi:hypothetical protein